MCDMCNGTTREQVLEDARAAIDHQGWSIQAALDRHDHVWAYTLGLTESYGHPELITIDDEVDRAAHTLHHLAERIRDGRGLEVGPLIVTGWPAIELVEVHPVHTIGRMMAVWHAFHAGLADDDRPVLEALQVVRPDVVAGGPRVVRTRLDQPYARTP